MISKWRHTICTSCWKLRNGERDPVRMKDPELEICCWCHKLHSSGIYVRNNPRDTPCYGEHGPTASEIEKFLHEYDQGLHKLSPEYEAALQRSTEEFKQKLRLGEIKIGGNDASS